MQWPSSFVAILLCIAVSADTDRPRRDLQTILKIKDAIASKIFGTNCSNTEKQNATFYRIPGHENILIKAVPIGLKVTQGAELINVPASPQNPTLALLESYLETSTPDDTLKALHRAQTLIQSGILTDQAALDKLLVHSRYPGQVSAYIAQDNYLYPGPLQAPLPAVPKPLPILTSGISYFDAPVGGPIHNSYGVPILQQPILFKEPKLLRPPVVHHHTILTGVRPETRVPAVVYGAFNPFFEDQKVNEQKIAKPASSYSYTQLHRNGAASTYGAQMPAEVAQVRPLVLERITEITNRLPNLVRPHIHSHPPRFSTIHRLPEVVVQDHYHPSVLNIPQQGGFSYKQVHNDGSVSTYYNNETPVRPVLLELPPKTSRLVKKYDGKGGYYYERVNADGSVTRCLDSEGRVPLPLNHFQSKPPVMHPIVHDRIEAIAAAPSQPAPAPPKISTQVNNSAGNQASNGYSYQQINSDGSVSSFHSSQVSSAAAPQKVVRPKPVRLPPPAVPEVELEHTVVVGAPVGPAPVVTLYDAPGVVATDPRGQQPVNVFPIPSSPHVHQYPVHVHAPPSHVHIQYPHQPLPSNGHQFASDVSVHKIASFVRPVHHHVESIGAGGFVYKQLQKDRSVTTQTSSGKVEGSQNLHVNSAAQKETQGAFVKPILGNYVYKQIVHNNPNFTVVKVENPSPAQSPSIDSRFGSYSYKQVTNINAASVKPVATPKPVATSKPLTSRVTQSGSKDQVKVIVGEDSIGTHSASGNFKYVQTNSPASTTTTTSQKVKPEDSLENNPIIVSDVTKAPAVNFSYKQNHDDGTTTSFQSSNENHITVKVNSEQEHQRGDIP